MDSREIFINSFRSVFIASDMSKSKQKLLSHFQVDLGDLASQNDKSISFYVVSLVEGTLELVQTVWYQTDQKHVSVSEDIVPKASPVREGPNATQQRTENHNICIKNINDTVVKSKKDTLVIPCTAEFLFSGKFFSLNKEPLKQAYRNEDFLLRVDLEVKSVEIDILDMFLISVSLEMMLFGGNDSTCFSFAGLQHNGATVQ